MTDISVIATTSFGLETVLGFELKNMGYESFVKENGRIILNTELSKIPELNINLRTAERIFIRLAVFKCLDFDDLYDNLLKISWADIINEDGKIIVNFKSVKSAIKSISNSQGISKKAIIETLKKRYKKDWFTETGADYKILVSLQNDMAEILLDTSGHGLNRRGYRAHHGEAPLRETLAASLIDLSRWRNDEVLIDPFCGSGTILIEAALKGRNTAPGLKSEFDSEKWDLIPQKFWDSARNAAKNKINNDELHLYGYDKDAEVIAIAKKNASKAGVGDCITFACRDIKNFSESHKKAFIITNPPYGERLTGDIAEVYTVMSEKFKTLHGWRIYILTGFENFSKIFRRSDKNRKLYNGKIKCHLHMFFNPEKN
ncbi:MAG: class I SAM-dependent RNA methyltransferase [Spirochaetes bacterium]|nr:class I SAM-dependent RNA methyltransferase [Spirochaetota bacterium]